MNVVPLLLMRSVVVACLVQVFQNCTFSRNEAWSNMATNAVGGAVSIDAVDSDLSLPALTAVSSNGNTDFYNVTVRPTPQFLECTFYWNVVRSFFEASIADSVCGCGGAVYGNGAIIGLNSTKWTSNYVSCLAPSPEGKAIGTGGALFIDAEARVEAFHSVFEYNGMVSAAKKAPHEHCDE